MRNLTGPERSQRRRAQWPLYRPAPRSLSKAEFAYDRIISHRTRLGRHAQYRRDFAKLIWQLASPQRDFDVPLSSAARNYSDAGNYGNYGDAAFNCFTN
jgi:hypothetical protein